MAVLKWFCLACALAAGAAAAPQPTVVRGELAGAKYTWLQPARWNQAVLLVAHDARSEDAPLTADFLPSETAYRQLVEEGWIVAKTSYRRNGQFVSDGIRDLDALRGEIARRLGTPERVLVEGNGLGGLIALAVAERSPESPPLYQGIIAADPSFDLRNLREEFGGLSLQPKIPVVFLCNRKDADAAARYGKVNFPKSVRPFVPVVLRVNRDGRLNFNQAERWVALRTANEWISDDAPTVKKPDETRDFIDITRVPEPQPSRVFFDENHQGFIAHIEEISEDHGQLTLDAQAADFAAAGIVPNAWFRAEIKGRSYRVRYAKDITQSKRAQWIAVLNADGFLWLSRTFFNAAESAGVQLGDLVHVTRYENGPAPTAEPGEDSVPGD